MNSKFVEILMYRCNWDGNSNCWFRTVHSFKLHPIRPVVARLANDIKKSSFSEWRRGTVTVSKLLVTKNEFTGRVATVCRYNSMTAQVFIWASYNFLAYQFLIVFFTVHGYLTGFYYGYYEMYKVFNTTDIWN